MIRLRSIFWLCAGLLLAAARPQLGAATVTGAVTNNFGIAQTNLPITFTPWPAQMPRALGGGGVMTGTGGRILTDAEGRFSVTLLPGLYSAQIGALATRAWLLEVPTNGGTFDWTRACVAFSAESSRTEVACRLGFYGSTAVGKLSCDSLRLEHIRLHSAFER